MNRAMAQGTEIRVEVNGVIISAVKTFNLLGIEMNEKCTFEDHWLKCCKKIKQKSGKINRLGDRFSFEFSRNLISSYIHGTVGHSLDYIRLFNRCNSGRLNAKLNNAVRGRFSTRSERKNRVALRQLKQYALLARCDLVSLDNHSRISRLCRLNKIAKTGLPAEEFDLLMKCFEVRTESRSNKGVPLLTHRPQFIRAYQTRICETQPFDAIEELNRLPCFLKKHFGTPKFDNLIKKCLKSVCQHSERNVYYCDNCGTSTGTLRGPTIASDDLRKMLQGGAQLTSWTKQRQKMKPEEVNLPEVTPAEHKTRLVNESLFLGRKFLAKCRELCFWGDIAE